MPVAESDLVGIANGIKQRLKTVLLHPRVGRVPMGTLRRLRPISNVFGYDRGRPVDRVYIETFLEANRQYIKGDLLEVGDDRYSRQYGEGIRSIQVISLDGENPQVSIVADLAEGSGVPEEKFDCIICVQTLQFIFDVRAAVTTLQRALKPGGMLLVTVPGISQISRYDMERWGDYWRFTSLSLSKLLAPEFREYSVESFGNVLSAMGLLHGLAESDLDPSEISFRDEDYQVIVAARALK